MEPLRKLRKPLSPHDLSEAIAGTGLSADRVAPEIPIDSLRDALAKLEPSLKGSALDQAMVEPVHRSLSRLPRAEAGDMRIWHWLCAAAFPDVVSRRWQWDMTSSGLPSPITDAVLSRFAGTASLVGVSRNTFARLWWTAENLGGDYDLARIAFSNQDMFQAIFERQFGLHEPAARAALTRFTAASEGAVREAARWLSCAGATTALEMLNEAEIGAILDESLRRNATAS